MIKLRIPPHIRVRIIGSIGSFPRNTAEIWKNTHIPPNDIAVAVIGRSVKLFRGSSESAVTSKKAVMRVSASAVGIWRNFARNPPAAAIIPSLRKSAVITENAVTAKHISAMERPAELTEFVSISADIAVFGEFFAAGNLFLPNIETAAARIKFAAAVEIIINFPAAPEAVQPNINALPAPKQTPDRRIADFRSILFSIYCEYIIFAPTGYPAAKAKRKVTRISPFMRINRPNVRSAKNPSFEIIPLEINSEDNIIIMYSDGITDVKQRFTAENAAFRTSSAQKRQ